MVEKILIVWNWLKKFMQVGIDVTSMHASFGGRSFFGFGDMASFQKRPNFPFGAWTIVQNLINWNQLKIYMQVGIEVMYTHTGFNGCGFFGFGDKISLWSIKVEKFNQSELAQKIHASRN